MDHNHSHMHGHDHGHMHGLGKNATLSRSFAIGAGINLVFVVLEAAWGFVTGSMGLLADAGHNLGDVASLLLAWLAYHLSRRLPTQDSSYGLRKSTILAALANGLVLAVVTGVILTEAVQRLLQPIPVDGYSAGILAFVGILVNGGSALLFLRDRSKDLNVRGTYLHLIADAAISAAVAIGCLAVGYTGLLWIDPMLAIAVSLFVLWSAWSQIQQSLRLALDRTPSEVDPSRVMDWLVSLPGVSGAHDLHIWALSTTENALSVHLVKPDGVLDDGLADHIRQELSEDFGIAHATIEWERGGSCRGCSLQH